ncbi:MAG TPA: trypsin-like peptidase domain-containing protein [Blastocatellia bacterium]|nr:trypsin-like peptidase domain-containing protein [Blastocatellia bacterium]
MSLLKYRTLKYTNRSRASQIGPIRLAGLSAAVTLVMAAASVSPAVQKSSNMSVEMRARVRQAIAAVGLVLVRSNDSPAFKPRGSAVIVRGEGVVVTSYHVIIDTSRTNRPYDEIHFALSSEGVAATSSSKRYRLQPVLLSRDWDLALLQIVSDSDGNALAESMVFPTVELGDSAALSLLDDIAIIGFPEKGGTTVTVNSGMVEGKDVLGNWIKTDARMIRGNSGGAAVNSEGKLVGIPTKVVVDSQPIDRNGDGFPDDTKIFGAVGFLRPSQLVASMLSKLEEQDSARPSQHDLINMMPVPRTVTVRGVVRSPDGKPLAGAVVGLLPAGVEEVKEANLLTWGGTDPEGLFVLNKPVPPGRYTIKAKAMGYQGYTREIEIDQKSGLITIDLIK